MGTLLSLTNREYRQYDLRVRVVKQLSPIIPDFPPGKVIRDNQINP